jgi:acyl-CoA thioesterase FadM
LDIREWRTEDSGVGLDEAMGWAMYAAGAWAMTARMEVKYRKPLPLGREVTVTAEVVRERGRVLDAEAQIRAPGGTVLVEARAMFVRIPRDKQSEMERYYRGAEREVPG